MTKDKHGFEELTAPAATAKELQISVATLRKYSLIVEKVTGKPYYYKRTKQNARLYSEKDIQDLKDFHKLSQENGLTLQEAAQQIYVLSEQSTEPQIAVVNEQQEIMNAPEVTKLLNALQQTIGQQNAALESLQKQLNRIEKQNKDLLAQQKKLANTTATDDDLARLPDISGIVEDEQTADSSLSENAEKITQVANVEAKSSDEVHEEILAKAKENAEKNAHANAHRTLEDMQVEPEKQHWWQKFIDM